MILKRCKEKKLPRVLTLIVIVSISFAVLAALSPAVSADTDGTVTTDTSINHGEIDINKYAKTSGIDLNSYLKARVTLTVNGSDDIHDTSAYYVLSDDVKYAGNATIEPDKIIGNTLRWDIGDLAPGTPWNVAFDVRPKRMGKNFPVSEVPFSMVTYEPGTPEETKKVTAGGCWILSPANYSKKATFGFVVQHKKGKESPEGELEFQDHATGMNLHSESIENLSANSGNSTVFSGNATVNGTSGYNFTVFANESESGNMTFMILIGGPENFSYRANGTLKGGNIKVHSGSSRTLEFPQDSVDMIGISLEDVNVSVPPKERVIGERVPVTGYAKVKNTGSEANVSVKLCVDGYPFSHDSVPIVVEEEEEILVSTPWIPMSSGRHTISIHVHGLKDDGTEFWTEAQGSENSKTTNKIIYIKRVR